MAIPQKLYSDKLSTYRESITILYRIDGDFKSICDDCCTIKFSIEKWKQKMQDNFHLKVERPISK